jgi:hypothetical protein
LKVSFCSSSGICFCKIRASFFCCAGDFGPLNACKNKSKALCQLSRSGSCPCSLSKQSATIWCRSVQILWLTEDTDSVLPFQVRRNHELHPNPSRMSHHPSDKPVTIEQYTAQGRAEPSIPPFLQMQGVVQTPDCVLNTRGGVLFLPGDDIVCYSTSQCRVSQLSRRRRVHVMGSIRE